MIDIRIEKDDGTLRVRLLSEGHAGTGEAGQDLVCAAVSSLIYGYAKVIALVDEKHIQARQIRAGELPGEATVDVICGCERIYQRVLHHIAPVERSLELLAQEYPNAVRLTVTR